MLEICHLTKRFHGITAVDDVSFTIRPGEILGYIGPNGAGKSTTVKMIVGLLDPRDGQILFDGRSVLEDLLAYGNVIKPWVESPDGNGDAAFRLPQENGVIGKWLRSGQAIVAKLTLYETTSQRDLKSGPTDFGYS
jgi:ABC-type cobalamin/Fe3+-siderophores transport system ATPase subunit